MTTLEVGEKVHIVERRYFPEDVRRHFAGECIKTSNGSFRLKGYVWIMELPSARWVRRPELRERIFSLGQRLTVNIIPREVNIDELKYVVDPERGLILTDGKKFSLDISEFAIQAVDRIIP